LKKVGPEIVEEINGSLDTKDDEIATATLQITAPDPDVRKAAAEALKTIYLEAASKADVK